ncbi:hypothetical protein [Halococcus agarilyticus]|uniref:hypothetical protein n=1 Tax=Halococcus agarilyticus TaxID=1232219 RepID=UPI0006779692|nr:hypothetical protein [Halococcus agarilyticus]
MRLIKLIVPDDDREAVLDVLREEDIDRVVTREASERDSSTLVEFPLPTQAVGYVLDELREAGFDDGRYRGGRCGRSRRPAFGLGHRESTRRPIVSGSPAGARTGDRGPDRDVGGSRGDHPRPTGVRTPRGAFGRFAGVAAFERWRIAR